MDDRHAAAALMFTEQALTFGTCIVVLLLQYLKETDSSFQATDSSS